MNTGDETVLNYGLPRSRDVPSLPGCVLAPLSSRSTAALLKVFTGGSDCSVPWETRCVSTDQNTRENVIRMPVAFLAVSL